MLTAAKKFARSTSNFFLYGKDVYSGLTEEQKLALANAYRSSFISTNPENIRPAAAEFKKEIQAIHSTSETSQTNNAWYQNLEKLRTHVLEEKDLQNFANWDVVQETMFHECAPVELRELRHSVEWNTYESILIEDSLGNPLPYRYYPKSSGNRIHTIYNLHQLLAAFKLDLSLLKTVFEFGGGYGSMAQLIYKLGFNGSYFLYDIPEFSALQKFYLSSLGMYPSKDIHFISESQEIPPIDLFIATWSLSESPTALREKIWHAVGEPNYILIAYQNEFESVNNKDYFSAFKEERLNYTWIEYSIPHLNGSSYLLGKKNHG